MVKKIYTLLLILFSPVGLILLGLSLLSFIAFLVGLLNGSLVKNSDPGDMGFQLLALFLIFLFICAFKTLFKHKKNTPTPVK